MSFIWETAEARQSKARATRTYQQLARTRREKEPLVVVLLLPTRDWDRLVGKIGDLHIHDGKKVLTERNGGKPTSIHSLEKGIDEALRRGGLVLFPFTMDGYAYLKQRNQEFTIVSPTKGLMCDWIGELEVRRRQDEVDGMRGVYNVCFPEPGSTWDDGMARVWIEQETPLVKTIEDVLNEELDREARRE